MTNLLVAMQHLAEFCKQTQACSIFSLFSSLTREPELNVVVLSHHRGCWEQTLHPLEEQQMP